MCECNRGPGALINTLVSGPSQTCRLKDALITSECPSVPCVCVVTITAPLPKFHGCFSAGERSALTNTTRRLSRSSRMDERKSEGLFLKHLTHSRYSCLFVRRPESFSLNALISHVRVVLFDSPEFQITRHIWFITRC